MTENSEKTRNKNQNLLSELQFCKTLKMFSDQAEITPKVDLFARDTMMELKPGKRKF